MGMLFFSINPSGFIQNVKLMELHFSFWSYYTFYFPLTLLNTDLRKSLFFLSTLSLSFLIVLGGMLLSASPSTTLIRGVRCWEEFPMANIWSLFPCLMLSLRIFKRAPWPVGPFAFLLSSSIMTSSSPLTLRPFLHSSTTVRPSALVKITFMKSKVLVPNVSNCWECFPKLPGRPVHLTWRNLHVDLRRCIWEPHGRRSFPF